MKTFRSSGAFLVAVVSLMALTACVPGSPVAAPTPEASPSETVVPEPEPTEEAPVAAANVVISASAITVFDAAVNTLVSIPFSADGVSAADQLTAVLGETPTVTAIDGTNCRRAGSEYVWGGLTLVTAGTITMAPGAVFSVFADGLTTAGGVELETTNGWHVGIPIADVIAALPDAVRDDSGDGWARIALENSGGSGPDVTGVLGVGQGGALVNISSPVYIFGDC